MSKDEHHNVTERQHRTGRALRTNLQKALLKKVQSHTIHLKKKLVSVNADRGGVTATFEDGTIATADILLGADGIHSVKPFSSWMQTLARH